MMAGQLCRPTPPERLCTTFKMRAALSGALGVSERVVWTHLTPGLRAWSLDMVVAREAGKQ
jgi:hypothetical protein